MLRTITLLSAAAITLSAFSVSSPAPAEARSMCQRVSGHAVRPTQDWAKMRAEKRLNRYVDRWAKKSGKSKVALSPIRTKCDARKSGWSECTARAKACI